jgi:hypothetical protein
LRADVRPGSSTGRTHHARGGESLPEPLSLLISQVDGDPGYYLSYLDDRGDAQTNTYHDSLEQAFRQAEFEFTIGHGDWQAIREE